MTTSSEEGPFLIHRFPKKLQLKIRIASARTGRLMRDIVIEACEEWLKKNGK